jgi:hypothetical protein
LTTSEDRSAFEPYLGGVSSTYNRNAYEDANLPREAGKQHEFVAMPNQHNLYGGVHDAYFIEKMFGFFERTLKNAGENRT